MIVLEPDRVLHCAGLVRVLQAGGKGALDLRDVLLHIAEQALQVRCAVSVVNTLPHFKDFHLHRRDILLSMT